MPVGNRLPTDAWTATHWAAMRAWMAEHRINPDLVPTRDPDAMIYLDVQERQWVVQVIQFDANGQPIADPARDGKAKLGWLRVPYRSDCPWPVIPA